MAWLFPILAFLIGSIPFGVLIARSRGIDLRNHGSGNIGATNVFRLMGTGPGVVCLLLDLLKGVIPVALATNLARVEGVAPPLPLDFLDGLATVYPATQQLPIQASHVVTALAAILGHNYSPWLGFKGGKGIATSAGVVMGLMPLVFGGVLVVFVVVFGVTRYVSLGSISAALCLPVFIHLQSRWTHVSGDPSQPTLWESGTWNKPLLAFAILSCALAVWKHKPNIERLLNGTESRMFTRKKSNARES